MSQQHLVTGWFGSNDNAECIDDQELARQLQAKFDDEDEEIRLARAGRSGMPGSSLHAQLATISLQEAQDEAYAQTLVEEEAKAGGIELDADLITRTQGLTINDVGQGVGQREGQGASQTPARPRNGYVDHTTNRQEIPKTVLAPPPRARTPDKMVPKSDSWTAVVGRKKGKSATADTLKSNSRPSSVRPPPEYEEAVNARSPRNKNTIVRPEDKGVLRNSNANLQLVYSEYREEADNLRRQAYTVHGQSVEDSKVHRSASVIKREEAYRLRKLANAADRKVAWTICVNNNVGVQPDHIDLHGLHSSDIHAVMPTIVKSKYLELGPGLPLHIITGKGNHSIQSNQKSVIRKKLQAWLGKNNITCLENDNPGMIIIKIPSRVDHLDDGEFDDDDDY